MQSKRYNRGRFVGETNELFSEGKIYRGKFDVYETVIIFVWQSKVYRSGTYNWEFEKDWEVK